MLQARRLSTYRSCRGLRFCLARSVLRQLLSDRAMHFGVRRTAAAISASALIFCCSCEKQHLDTPARAEENFTATKEASKSPTADASPTPAEFFPESTPP